MSRLAKAIRSHRARRTSDWPVSRATTAPMSSVHSMVAQRNASNSFFR